ncbi:MAG TPA: hypothetical protein VF427_12410, partial [Noviherbaspirillum sp.]
DTYLGIGTIERNQTHTGDSLRRTADCPCGRYHSTTSPCPNGACHESNFPVGQIVRNKSFLGGLDRINRLRRNARTAAGVTNAGASGMTA